MNRTSSIPSLWQTDGEAGAGVDRKVPRVVLGLAALALLAVAALAVMSGFEAGVARVSEAVFEASPAQWSALTARHVPDYGAIGGATNHLGSMARGREGMLSSGLAVRGKIGLGRIDSLHVQVNAASVGASSASYAANAARGRDGMISVVSVAPSATSFGTYAARGREGMLSSGLAVRGKIGLGRIDSLHVQVSAASVAASPASPAARGREGMLSSGLAVRGKLGLGRIDSLRSRLAAQNAVQSEAVDTHYAGDY